MHLLTYVSIFYFIVLLNSIIFWENIVFKKLIVENIIIGFTNFWCINISQLVSSDILLWVFFVDVQIFTFSFLKYYVLFLAKDELENYCQYDGLLHGGGFYLLYIQTLMALSLTVWAMVVTYILLWVSLAIMINFCVYLVK